MSQRTAVQALAMAMLKNTPTFQDDPASPETIWQDMTQDVQNGWRKQAETAMIDLARLGYQINRID